jgi:hypothetical protein
MGKRPRGSRYILIRIAGRTIVMRRKPSVLAMTGTAMTIAGINGLAWGTLGSLSADSISRAGGFALLAGMLVMLYKRLETMLKEHHRMLSERNMSEREIERFAYDRGHEDGYEERDCEIRETQVLRPTVVPLPVRERANTTGLASVGRVADRG